jgi:hypothetical protein
MRGRQEPEFLVPTDVDDAHEPGGRRTVCAALLIRMSSGSCAATSSARATTWAGSRRSMPTTRSRCNQSALSSIAAKRRTASLGNRLVIVVCGPSRNNRSAMYMPVLQGHQTP